MKRFVPTITAAICILFFASQAWAEKEAMVALFSPQGMVKNVRQVTARFSEQMVPFGDSGLTDPFEITGDVKGKGRWADGKNWVYDFDRNLPAGVICAFTLKPDLKTLSGKTVIGKSSFTFSTGGPAIIRSNPYKGHSSIDEEQVFIIVTDASATEKSIMENVYFSVKGISEKIGIRLLNGAERKMVLDAARFRVSSDEYSDPDNLKPEEMPQVVVIQSKQRFPVATEVYLIWGKGVTSLSGVPTETDQVLSFKSRTAFSAQFSCEREKDGANCIPFLPMRLSFSSKVPFETAEKIRLKGQNGKVYMPHFGSDEYSESVEQDGNTEGSVSAEKKQEMTGRTISTVIFQGPFPENSSFNLDLPKNIRDDSGRLLSNADKFPLAVRTDAFPPLAKFSSRFGIIELKGDATLPVTVRNIEPKIKTRMLKIGDAEKGLMEKAQEGILDKAVKIGETLNSVLYPLKEPSKEMYSGIRGRLHKIRMGREEKIIEWMKILADAKRDISLLKETDEVVEFSIPKPGGAKAFEVIGIPMKEPGFYVVEIESQILGSALLGDGFMKQRQRPMYVPAGALVTNLAVHLKEGRESSLVWVTTLDNGMPVPDASVSVRNIAGKIIWSGKTDSSGIARISESLRSKMTDNAYDGYYVFAAKGKDMSFVHSEWNDGIEVWRFNLPFPLYNGPVIAHTIFDRTLVRAGETVHMKHLMRKRTMTGITSIDSAQIPSVVFIEHQGSGQYYEFPVNWTSSGISETTWEIPRDAKLGLYEVYLIRKEEKGFRGKAASNGISWKSGSFRVEEFRIPMMKGIIQPPKEPVVNTPEIDVDLMVSYLSGGGAGNAAVTLRHSLQPKTVRFDNYDNFTFANGMVKESLVSSAVSGRSEEEGEDAGIKKPDFRSETLTLDPSGALRTKVGLFPVIESPGEVLTELEFKDPNGEIQTVSAKIPVWNSRIILGIKPDSWVAAKENFKFQLLALDLSGNPVPGILIKADLFRRKNYTHRKRLIGGFYSYEHFTEIKKIGSLCEGKTDKNGLVVCEAKSPVSGNVIIQAQAKDSAGNAASVHQDTWIHGKSDWWFDVSDNDRIDLLPEKKHYEPGETAKFQARMPFRNATVLVTIEREGVIEAFTKQLSGKNPVIEVPVKGNYAPNVFVSALCVRGRVEGVKPTALVDLGKPAFKLGISEINVGWKAHELKVDVSAEKEVYRIREEAPVRIKVRTAYGKLPPKGSEVAVAVVDEGLLELMPNNSWKLLDAMMARRGYEVNTATAQMQVVGKRHFGLKAIPHGGSGGRETTRELFDTLLMWKGRVMLNENGEAFIKVRLNDSLTSFRIAAVANSPQGLFGTGETSVRSTQDLMLISGLPPLVREEDSFRAGFTVRNASKTQMEVVVSALSSAAKTLEPISISLQQGEAKEIGWEIPVPSGVDSISWEVTAKNKNGDSVDKIKVNQKVTVAVPVRTYQATITQLKDNYTLKIKKPDDAIKSKGGIGMDFRSKLSEGLSGISEYMRNYEYTCLEQKISVAVSLRDKMLWEKALSLMPSCIDSDGLLKYFPSMNRGSDTLTAYALSVSAEAGLEIPQHIKEKLNEGLVRFVNGQITRHSSMQAADLTIRKITALEALSRSVKIKPELLESILIDPNLWPTSALIDWINILIRSERLPERDARLKEAEMILRSRLYFTGSTMGFSTEKSDCLWWLMITGDVNAVRSILTLTDLGNWDEDIPRIVKGAVGRQNRGRWNNTVANAWGVLAMDKFSKKYESVPVAGISSAALGSQEKSLDWSASSKGGTLNLDWPDGEKPLIVTHKGGGSPWVTVRSNAAIPQKEAVSNGYRIKKSLVPIRQKESGRWSKGDVYRVRLEIEAQSDMTWVVVNDPIPAGSMILGVGLGRDSHFMTQKERNTGWVWPAFEERSFEAFRAYYEYAPKGKWSLEYTVRLNNEGSFVMPVTRVEAMYATEMFGELPNPGMAIGSGDK